jgi:hypothetical protein
MTTILICASSELEQHLSHTLFWRDDLERYVSEESSDAMMLAFSAEPHIVVVDGNLPGVEALVAALRSRPLPHPVSIVALSHGIGGLQASGVDAVLSWPPGPEWDERLVEVLKVPTRQQVRYDVHFDIEARLRQRRDVYRGLALNISAGGLLAQAGVSLTPGDDLELLLPLPGDGPVEGRARVVRQPLEERLGLRFEAFRGNGDSRVREFLEALAAQQQT